MAFAACRSQMVVSKLCSKRTQFSRLSKLADGNRKSQTTASNRSSFRRRLITLSIAEDVYRLTASGIDDLIVQLNQGLGITVVIVTHDLTTLLSVCDRVAVLVDGKITVGTVDKLARSQDPWIREFLHGPRAQGAMNARRSNHGIR